MSDLFTSYSTSVALRDAGAPQDGRYVRRASGKITSWQCEQVAKRTYSREELAEWVKKNRPEEPKEEK